MESGKSLVAMGLCVLVVFAFVADQANAQAQQCSLTALEGCYGAVAGSYPPKPTQACCTPVMTANPDCLCQQFKQGRYAPNMIRNAFAIPKACGRTNLSGYKCGPYTIE